MNERTFEVMPVNQLWTPRETINTTLAVKILAEKKDLDMRLAQLSGQLKTRRPYPKVYPKYYNPAQPAQTWSGRGIKPHWFNAQLNSGKSVEDLRIPVTHERMVA